MKWDVSTSFPGADAAGHALERRSWLKPLEKSLAGAMCGQGRQENPGSHRYEGKSRRTFCTDLEGTHGRIVERHGKAFPGDRLGGGKGRHCQKGLKFCPDSSLHLLCRTKAVNCCGGRRRRPSTLTAQGNWGEEKTLYLWDKEEHCITIMGLGIQKDNDPKFGST